MTKRYCVYLTRYSGDLLPEYYVGSTSMKKIDSGYHGSVASRKYKALWYQELKSNPHFFSTEIISLYDTRLEALDAELIWQLERKVVEDKNFVNMSYAKAKFYGLSTPELIEAFKESIAARTPEQRQAIHLVYQEKQKRVMAARSPEKIKQTAEKQSKSLAKNHANRTQSQKEKTAELKRLKLASHDADWHAEVNARRSIAATKRWAKHKEIHE